MVIIVRDLVPVTVTEEEGAKLFGAIQSALRQHDIVTVSFEGIKTATTSFVNTAFVPLLDVLKFEEIKRRIQIVQSNRQINHMIKWRLESETSTLSHAQ